MNPQTERFRFIAEALNGTGGFLPPRRSDLWASPTGVVTYYQGGLSYLVQYPRESAEKFARRRAIAWYTQDLRSACARFVGHLFSRSTARTVSNPLLEVLLDDCDQKGSALDVFWQQFALEAKARGTMLLAVDMPTELPATQAEQLDRRAVPYLYMIEPELVTDVQVDVQGRITRVEIDYLVQAANGPTKGTKVWTTDGWAVRVGDRVVESGDHNLGVCPVLAFSENEFLQEGEFGQIADLSRRLYNLRSELDEILRGQTFSVLAYPMPEGAAASFNPQVMKDVSETVGTHNMLVHFGGPPAFIAPPDGPASIYLQQIDKVEQLIHRAGHQIDASHGAVKVESGVALEIRFQALNASLAHFARRMQDLELRVWDLAGRWLGISSPVQVSWPQSFQIADLAREIAVLQQMQAAGAPEEYVREKMKRIIGLDMGASEPQSLQDIYAAIDGASAERLAQVDPAADAAADAGPSVDPTEVARLNAETERGRIAAQAELDQAKLAEQRRAEEARVDAQLTIEREKIAAKARADQARLDAEMALEREKLAAEAARLAAMPAPVAQPPALPPLSPAAPQPAPITMVFGTGSQVAGDDGNSEAVAAALVAVTAAMAQVQRSVSADRSVERDAAGQIVRVRTDLN